MDKTPDLKSPMKFLFICSDEFPPYRVDISMLFGEEMVRRGHSMDFLLQSEGECKKSYQTVWSGCRAWVGRTDTGTTRMNRLIKNSLDILHSINMFSLIRKNPYDFIQVKDKFVVALIAMLAAKIYRKKLVYWLSYPIPEAYLYAIEDGSARYPILYYLRGTVLQWLLYRIIMPRADHVFVQSEQMKRDVMAHGIPEDKLTPVLMGISPDMFASNGDGKSGEPDTNHPSVVYLGTLRRVRRIDFLLRVFAHVTKDVPGAKLYMMGKGDDPSDLETLKKEARELNLSDSVVFTGFLPRDAAFEIVKKASVCVSPFFPTPVLNSTSPTKLMEYMAMGKPVVANDHPEQRLVIEASGGGLCVPYEEKAFAAAIVTLLQDPLKACEMGRKGKEYVYNNRTYAKISDEVEKRYRNICQANADPGLADSCKRH